MATNWDAFQEGVAEAKKTFAQADSIATDMANLLCGRLRKVTSAWALERLKRELREFNIHTGAWKD